MKEKGVTLVALVIVIIVLLLIAGTATLRTTMIDETNKYTKFKDDLTSLEESISQVYGQSDSLEGIGPIYDGDKTFLSATQDGNPVKNPNDGDDYYVINAEKLNYDLFNKYNIHLAKLNYGAHNYGVAYSDDESFQSSTSSLNSVYIINKQSWTIYYTAGVKYRGKMYYRASENFTKITTK